MSSNRPPIAIVGVSALFPGSTNSSGFWKDILAGSDLITDVPQTHWLIDDYFDEDKSKADRTYAHRGGFIPKVDFDALGWGVPPSLLSQTDTSQLLALIVAQKVLDDASKGHDIDRNRLSCILGVTSAQELLGEMVSRLQHPIWRNALRQVGLPESKVTEAVDAISSHYADWTEATFPGLLGNVVAGRIANRLDLGGTNCVTDAACASTFSALQMAVQELYLGDSDAVICGGVDTMNDIFMYMCFSKTPALSATGDCRPFSDQADGTMLGEGLGMFLLKRLEDAERDGDTIYATITGVGSSSDGRAKSVYAPLPRGQAKAIRRAYERSGFGVDTVELVEAHGTGTKAGDAAEFEGLKTVFDECGREDRQWCAVGSVKSQIGHTKAAAGAAGLFKAVLALHQKTLPPTIKVDRPNPGLELEKTGLYVNTEARPWVRGADHPRRAGVSSFGFGGSNFHIAMEEYTGELRQGRHDVLSHHIVVVTGADGAAVAKKARELAAFTETHTSEQGAKALPHLARTTQAAYDATAPARLAVVAKDDADLVSKLNAAATGIEKAPGKALSKPVGVHYGVGQAEGSVAFLFPGQGSQYVGMGSHLARSFDAAISAWDDAHTAGLNTHHTVYPRPVFSDDARAAQQKTLTNTDNAQPAIGVASMATLRMLRSVGLEAAQVGGHSYGELTALHAAGALSTASFFAASAERGARMAEAAATTEGTMAAVRGPAKKVASVLGSAHPDVVLANLNSPKQTVISGPVPAIEAAVAALEAAGVMSVGLPVATAFHSPIVAGASKPYGAFLADLDVASPTIPAWSNAEAAPYPADANAIRTGLSEQIAKPVRFVEMIEGMYADGVRTFVEVGPGSVLSGLVKRILRRQPHTAVSTDRKGGNGIEAFFTALAALVADGRPMNLGALLSEYRDAVDPSTVKKPRIAIPIDGTNVDKPYPPKKGAAGRATPNPETTPEVKVVEKVVDRIVEKVVYKQAPNTSSSAPANAAPHSAAAVRSEATMSNQNTPHPSVQLAWVTAWQETQRQTADAHSAFQRSMADSHAAFLKTAETSFMGLATVLSGGGVPTVAHAAPQTVTLPAPAPAPVVAAPAPVVAAPAPVVAAPAPVVAAPAPVVAAPAPAPVVAAPAPAPVVAAPAPAAPASSGQDLSALMLSVVAEKTGYPAEMLSLDMDLEGDLGVDSIKRVEILSAVQEKAPELAGIDASSLGALRTLGEIVEAMGGSATAAPAPAAAAPAAAAPASSGKDLSALMLSVVAEKTGYPAEMLSLDMDLEGDLGVDSIKRVEILSAVQEQAPELAGIDASSLGALRTLGEIVEAMGGSADAPAAAPAAAEEAAAPAAGARDLSGLMLTVVAEKTGYPAEMLSLDMDLEGDLGVDSIKRVEILSAVQEQAPELAGIDASSLGALRTLGEIVEAMGGTTVAPAASDDPAAGRYAPTAVAAPASGMARRGLPPA